MAWSPWTAVGGLFAAFSSLYELVLSVRVSIVFFLSPTYLWIRLPYSPSSTLPRCCSVMSVYVGWWLLEPSIHPGTLVSRYTMNTSIGICSTHLQVPCLVVNLTELCEVSFFVCFIRPDGYILLLTTNAKDQGTFFSLQGYLKSTCTSPNLGLTHATGHIFTQSTTLLEN